MKNTPSAHFTYGEKQHAFLHTYDGIIASLATIAATLTLFIIPYGSLYYGNRSEGDIGTLITVAIIAGVQTLLLASVFLFLEPKEATQTPQNQPPLRFPFKFSLISFAAMWVMAAVWVFIHLSHEGPFLIALLAVPFFIAIGILFGALAWLFVAAPLNMFVRGVYYLVAKKEIKALEPLMIAGILLSAGALIVLMPIAGGASSPGRGAAIDGFVALFGIPTAFHVENNTAFASARFIAIGAAILIMLYIILMSKKRSKTTKSSTI